MRIVIRGRYPAEWAEISRETKTLVGWRCVRCRHPFDPGTGRPMPCDADCDQRRGRGSSERLRHDYGLEQLKDVGSAFNIGVHHADGDRGNNRWWNLWTLCNTCHLHVQARVILERPWLLDHTPWAIPYMCGFYAFYYGDLEISREQAAADPARWLAMGQPWRAADAASLEVSP